VTQEVDDHVGHVSTLLALFLLKWFWSLVTSDVNTDAMFCGFIRTHCYKVAITALVVLVFFQYGFGVFYEENRRINEAYFTFNLTAPRLSGAAGTYNDTDFNYAATANMTLIALQSSNSSDPYQLDLLADSLNFTRKPLMCPLVSPLLGEF